MSPVERVEYFIPTCRVADGGCGAFVGEQYTDPRDADDEQLEHDLMCSVPAVRRSAERRLIAQIASASSPRVSTEATDAQRTRAASVATLDGDGVTGDSTRPLCGIKASPTFSPESVGTDRGCLQSGVPQRGPDCEISTPIGARQRTSVGETPVDQTSTGEIEQCSTTAEVPMSR
jgi:hypothetical protein